MIVNVVIGRQLPESAIAGIESPQKRIQIADQFSGSFSRILTRFEHRRSATDVLHFENRHGLNRLCPLGTRHNFYIFVTHQTDRPQLHPGIGVEVAVNLLRYLADYPHLTG